MADKNKDQKDDPNKVCRNNSKSYDLPDGPLPGRPDWNPAPHKPRNYWEIRLQQKLGISGGKGGGCEGCDDSGGCSDSGSGGGGGSEGSGKGSNQSGSGARASTDCSGSGGNGGGAGSASGSNGGCCCTES